MCPLELGTRNPSRLCLEISHVVQCKIQKYHLTKILIHSLCPQLCKSCRCKLFSTCLSFTFAANSGFLASKSISFIGKSRHFVVHCLVVAKYVEIWFQVNHNDEFRPNIKVGLFMVTREQPENSQLNLAEFIN